MLNFLHRGHWRSIAGRKGSLGGMAGRTSSVPLFQPQAQSTTSNENLQSWSGDSPQPSAGKPVPPKPLAGLSILIPTETQRIPPCCCFLCRPNRCGPGGLPPPSACPCTGSWLPVPHLDSRALFCAGQFCRPALVWTHQGIFCYLVG